ADVHVDGDLAQLLDDLIRRADDDIAAVDDVLHLARDHVETRAGGRAGGALRGERILGLVGRVGGLGRGLDLALEADALRCLGDVARRRGKAQIDVQAATVEVLGGLRVALHGLRAALGHANELQETGPIGIAVLAELGHLVPEALHGPQSGLVAVVGEIAVDVVHLRAPLPRLDGSATRDPNRRMWLLDGPRPDVYIALLVEATVEG